MPHTYPPNHRNNITTTPKPPPSSSTSKFLTPTQSNRINSWRQQTEHTPTPPTSSVTTPGIGLPPLPSQHTPHPRSSTSISAKVKSAPASLAISRNQSYTSLGACGVQHSGACSCTTSIRAQRQKGYYKKKSKKGTATGTGTISGSTIAPTPLTPIGTSVLSPPPVTPTTPLADKRGLPSPQQVAGYQNGTAPMTAQYGNAPEIPLPEPVLAKPAAQPEPRIAGARDPISQNYWKQMFPPTSTGMYMMPAGMGMGMGMGMPFVQPGAHPPQMFGMPMSRQFGF